MNFHRLQNLSVVSLSSGTSPCITKKRLLEQLAFEVSWSVTAVRIKINLFPNFSSFVLLIYVCCPVANPLVALSSARKTAVSLFQ